MKVSAINACCGKKSRSRMLSKAVTADRERFCKEMKENGKQLKDCPWVQPNKIQVWLAPSDNGRDKVKLSFDSVAGS